MSNLPVFDSRHPTWSLTRVHLLREGEERERKGKNLRDKERGGGGAGENERENCEVGGAALCTNVNPSVSGGGQRASGGQPPSGLFAAVGRGIGRVVHTKLFNGSFITMGWWFTFIRPAAKSLVCIWSLATPPPPLFILDALARNQPENATCLRVPSTFTDPSWKIGSDWDMLVFLANLSFPPVIS